jgi:uncharacterized peroxidase-related enzyme
MSDKFPLHTRESAPEDSKGVLTAMHNKFGFDANLFAKLATSSKALKAYTGINEIFARSSFSPLEQQVVLLTVSNYNGCDYCVAAHTTGSLMQNLSEEAIRAAGSGTVIADKKLEALRQFTRKMVDQRGYMKEGELDSFLAAGYTSENALEVVVGIAMKTLSNYANHIMDTPIDEAFAANAPKS